jgi:hypothetical protein
LDWHPLCHGREERQDRLLHARHVTGRRRVSDSRARKTALCVNDGLDQHLTVRACMRLDDAFARLESRPQEARERPVVLVGLPRTRAELNDPPLLRTAGPGARSMRRLVR